MVGIRWVDAILAMIVMAFLYFKGFNAIAIIVLIMQATSLRMQLHESKYHKEKNI